MIFQTVSCHPIQKYSCLKNIQPVSANHTTGTAEPITATNDDNSSTNEEKLHQELLLSDVNMNTHTQKKGCGDDDDDDARY